MCFIINFWHCFKVILEPFSHLATKLLSFLQLTSCIVFLIFLRLRLLCLIIFFLFVLFPLLATALCALGSTSETDVDADNDLRQGCQSGSARLLRKFQKKETARPECALVRAGLAAVGKSGKGRNLEEKKKRHFVLAAAVAVAVAVAVASATVAPALLCSPPPPFRI